MSEHKIISDEPIRLDDDKNTFDLNKVNKFEWDPLNTKIVKLNVGGTIFTSTISTLTRHSEYFRALFDKSLDLSEIGFLMDEIIFIDRDPKLFEQVLAYFRNELYDFGNINPKNLISEFNYYMIKVPQSLQNKLNNPHTIIVQFISYDHLNYSSPFTNKNSTELQANGYLDLPAMRNYINTATSQLQVFAYLADKFGKDGYTIFSNEKELFESKDQFVRTKRTIIFTQTS